MVQEEFDLGILSLRRSNRKGAASVDIMIEVFDKIKHLLLEDVAIYCWNDSPRLAFYFSNKLKRDSKIVHEVAKILKIKFNKIKQNSGFRYSTMYKEVEIFFDNLLPNELTINTKINRKIVCSKEEVFNDEEK